MLYVAQLTGGLLMLKEQELGQEVITLMPKDMKHAPKEKHLMRVAGKLKLEILILLHMEKGFIQVVRLRQFLDSTISRLMHYLL
jgi:hypothetical protein